MATAILILLVGLLSFLITPLVGYLNHPTLRKTDLMAGDEGE